MNKIRIRIRVRGRIFLLIASLSVSLFLPAARAQTLDSGENDFFNEALFDESVNQDVKKESEQQIEYLAGGNIAFTSGMRALENFSAYYGTGRLYGQAFLKISLPDAGMFFISYNLSHYLFQGTNTDNPFIRDLGADLFTVDFALSELYLAFDLGKRIFFRLGNQLVAWGPAFFWTPGDFINLQKKNAYDKIDLRSGKPAFKMHVPFGSIANFYFATDFSRTSNASAVPDMFKKTNLAVRLDATLAGMEWGMSVFGGAETDWKYGADLSGKFLGIDFYTETGLSLPCDPEAPSPGLAAGLQKELGEQKEWNLQSEFFFNAAGYHDKPDYLLLLQNGSYNPFYMGMYYLFASVSLDKLFNGHCSLALSCVMNLSDFSYSPRLAVNWTLPYVIPFSLVVHYNGGGEGKEFTFLYGDNSVSVNWEASLKF